MEKLKALMDFTMFAEKIEVPKGKEIIIDNVEKTIYENGDIIVNQERANQIEEATFDGKPLVERVKIEQKKEQPKIETAGLKTKGVETADIKPKRTTKNKAE